MLSQFNQILSVCNHLILILSIPVITQPIAISFANISLQSSDQMSAIYTICLTHITIAGRGTWERWSPLSSVGVGVRQVGGCSTPGDYITLDGSVLVPHHSSHHHDTTTTKMLSLHTNQQHTTNISHSLNLLG